MFEGSRKTQILFYANGQKGSKKFYLLSHTLFLRSSEFSTRNYKKFSTSFMVFVSHTFS
jgi:hypothetical protein